MADTAKAYSRTAGQPAWSEHRIAAALARQVFNNKHLVVVPRCGWTGYECDLLVVTRCLRVIDVEVKISRSDLRADAKKDKWYHAWDWRLDGPWEGWHDNEKRRPREWPRKVWKHYYAVPADIWDDALYDSLPSERSGVILMTAEDSNHVSAKIIRRATPFRDAERISPGDAVDIARIASLRMWDALARRH